MVDLSIIIPAFKSREILVEQLPVLFSWINNWNYKTEVIIIVDGEDLSAYTEVLHLFPVTITGYERNRGKGYAIKYGFNLAKAPIVIFTDADIPFTNADMMRMVETLHRNISEKVWVIGDRTLPGSFYYDYISPIRKAGSDFFLLIIKLTLGKDFADTQCGLKGFTRKAGEIVFNMSHVNRFAFDFECLYIVRHKKMKVIKIPVTLRNQSPSTVRIYSDGMKLLKDIFKVIFYYKYD